MTLYLLKANNLFHFHFKVNILSMRWLHYKKEILKNYFAKQSSLDSYVILLFKGAFVSSSNINGIRFTD